MSWGLFYKNWEIMRQENSIQCFSTVKKEKIRFAVRIYKNGTTLFLLFLVTLNYLEKRVTVISVIWDLTVLYCSVKFLK